MLFDLGSASPAKTVSGFMKFSEYLNVFSVADLREMAVRRGILLTPAILSSRQTMVRTLAGALERYDSVYGALGGLNQAEYEFLRHLLRPGKRAGLTALAQAFSLEPGEARAILDGLRLWGLVFPEGNWEHIIIPAQTLMAQHYMPPSDKKPAVLRAPALQLTEAECAARPGSPGWDLAEFLARVLRGRLKLTQAGRMNRRDLKAMENAFSVETGGYTVFLSVLAGALGVLQARPDGVLTAAVDTDDLLGQPQQLRAQLCLAAWLTMQGYAENAPTDPAEYEYVPVHLSRQRQKLAQVLAEIPDNRAVTIESLYQRLVWLTPMSFQQWDVGRDPSLVAARMVRSLYWLGLLAVDDGERPRHARLTPLALHILEGASASSAALVPEEPLFFLQPNAEIFAPPNLSPRTLLHVRRLTGEKKGGPAGMYPLTAESLRRGLDSGMTTGQILIFLERFSRTGLPSNVRAMVETTGRQHGRIRLIPAGYVVVTDTPELMQELNRLKSVQPVLGMTITERASAITPQIVPELMRNLRARGYAPVNEADAVEGPELPDDPNEEPAPLSLQTGGLSFAPGLDDLDEEAALQPGAIPLEEGVDEGWEPAPIGTQVDDRELVLDLLDYAFEEGEVLEGELQGGSPPGEPTPFRFWPSDFRGRNVIALAHPSGREYRIKSSHLAWVRRTGELYPVE